jgi:formylglycine-generating enzyme required for sulfatase activity
VGFLFNALESGEERNMKKAGMIFCLVAVCLMALANFTLADTFGTGNNAFTLDFVTISGNASSANGTNISPWLPSQDGYKTFTDPGNDYRIGKFEITNDQWDKFKAAYGTVTGGSLDSHWTGSSVPTNSVNWYEAAQFVNYLNTSTGYQSAYKFAGTQGTSNYTFDIWNASDAGYNPSNPYRNSNAFYFMPTEDEWVKAAYWNGTSLQTHATKPGESLTQGNGISGTGWNYYTTQFATNPAGPWVVGSGSEELNGTFDMMGNIIEWMEGQYHSEDYSSDSHRIVRGGAYNNEKEPFGSLYDGYDTLESSFRIWDCYPYGEYYTIGFRVASVPEPCSLALLFFGGLTLRYRKR